MKKLLIAFFSVAIATTCFSQAKPIKLDPSYEHDKWATKPRDQMFQYEAFTVSFDGKDDNNNDGSEDVWGIPEWVSYEIKEATKKYSVTRPKWSTDSELHKNKIAPSDDTYNVGGTKELKVVKTDYRFVRGHMCAKDTAARISADAAYNTHVLMNAVPQLQWQNNGIWKSLEDLSESWADKYGQVWVICGPVFFEKKPSMWLGQDKEVKAAIPDALFKIVIREEEDSLETLAFIIPNILPKEQKKLDDFLVSIKQVEKATGLTFLSAHEGISTNEIKEIKETVHETIEW